MQHALLEEATVLHAGAVGALCGPTRSFSHLTTRHPRGVPRDIKSFFAFPKTSYIVPAHFMHLCAGTSRTPLGAEVLWK